ncbi:MAG TPA: hypothetical protein VHS81_07525 [Caulobacteraceae bacterium]|nr:hypothetical protein [Caulobacteraceae bacterium]
MSDLAPIRPTAVVLPSAPGLAGAPADDGARSVALLVYVLNLASFVMPPLIVGAVILAYMNRETAPDWLKSHFTFQVRTFWLYLGYLAVSILLCAVLIGFLLIFAAIGWFVTRQVLGLNWTLKREACPRPTAWI